MPTKIVKTQHEFESPNQKTITIYLYFDYNRLKADEPFRWQQPRMKIRKISREKLRRAYRGKRVRGALIYLTLS